MSYFPNTGFVDQGNSSTSAIGANDTFTGSAIDVSPYSMITVFLDPDASGTLKMQFSVDSVTWDRQKVVSIPKIDGTVGAAPHTLGVVSQYFRVVYENGVEAQTKFNLQTILHTSKSKHLTSSPNEVISDQNDVELMRISNDVNLDIARGAFKDKSSVHKFGVNDNVNNSTFENIWNGGGLITWPQSAETLYVSSTNANDSFLSDGARTFVIEGLDGNFSAISETIELSGTTTVATTNTFSRVNRAFVSSVGVYDGSNIGTVEGYHGGAASSLIFSVGAGLGQTQLGHYTVEAGFTAYISKVVLNVANTKDAEIKMFRRSQADRTSAPFGAKRIVARWVAVTGEVIEDYDAVIPIPEKSDIFFEALGSAAGGTEIEVEFDMIVIRNSPGGLVEPQ